MNFNFGAPAPAPAFGGGFGGFGAGGGGFGTGGFGGGFGQPQQQQHQQAAPIVNNIFNFGGAAPAAPAPAAAQPPATPGIPFDAQDSTITNFLATFPQKPNTRNFLEGGKRPLSHLEGLLDPLRKSDGTEYQKLHSYALRQVFRSFRKPGLTYATLSVDKRKLLTEAEWDDAGEWKETFDLGEDAPQETLPLMPDPVEGFTGLQHKFERHIKEGLAVFTQNLSNIWARLDTLERERGEAEAKMARVRDRQSSLTMKMLEVCKLVDLDFTCTLRNPESQEEEELRIALQEQIRVLQEDMQVYQGVRDLSTRVNELARDAKEEANGREDFTAAGRGGGGGGRELDPSEQVALVKRMMDDLKFLQHAVGKRMEELRRFKGDIDVAQEAARSLQGYPSYR